MRLVLLLSMASMALALAARTARAQAPGQEESASTLDEDRTLRASPARFLPGAVTPEAGQALMMGVGWAGYDGATQAPLLGAGAEARLGKRLVIGVGATYAPGTPIHPGAVRPSVVARFQVLDQTKHGIDGGIAVAYREDRFVAEDGFFQAAISVGQRSSRATWLANFAFGSDGEGDDREGEVRLAGLRRVAGELHAGLDGRFRTAIASTDVNRSAHGTPSLEYMAGPVAAYTLGPWALTLEAGLSGVRTDSLHNGLATLGGVGAVF